VGAGVPAEPGHAVEHHISAGVGPRAAASTDP